MSAPLQRLRQRVEAELDEIAPMVIRAQTGWETYRTLNNDLLLDSVALSLHGFYSGIERIFEEIATKLDRNLPGGAAWHKALVQQMANEVRDIRPAVISPSSAKSLDEYRRFRHLVRNVYSYRLNPKKIEPLVASLPAVFSLVRQELVDFLRWLTN